MLPSEIMEFYSLVLFLPGIAIADYASARFRLKLTLLDKLIVGSLLWNFVFVSIASAASLAFDGFVTFSYYFAYASLSIIVLYLIANAKRFMNGLSRFRLEVDQTTWMFLLYIVPILIVVAILGAYVTISAEWDIWAIWLPLAKSIANTGGIIYNSYFLGSFTSASEPPLVPLIYAWTYVCAGGSFRLIPVLYLLLLGGASYKLSYAVFERKEPALTVAIVVWTSLVTLAAFFGHTFDPDLPAAFFFCSAAAYLVLVLKSDSSSRNALIMTLSLSLLILTRAEGILFAYVCLALALLATSVPYKKWFSLVLFISPFVLQMLRFGDFYYLPLLTAYCVAVMILIVKSAIPSSLGLRRIPLVLAPLISPVVYLWQIGARTGLWAYGLVVSVQFSQVYYELQRIFTAVPASVLGTTPTPTLVNLLRLDDIFLRYDFLPISVPLVIGLVVVSKRNSIQTRVLCLFLIALLLLALSYPEEFYPSLLLDYSLIRRYLFVIPFVAAISVFGLDWIVRKFASLTRREISSSAILLSLVLFNAMLFSTISFYYLTNLQRVSPIPINSVSALQLMQVPVISHYATSSDLVLVTAALFVSAGIAVLLSSVGQSHTSSRAGRKIISIATILIIVFSSFSAIYAFEGPIEDVMAHGTSVRDYLPPSIGGLVTYFDSVPGDGTVIGFQVYFLATFANRSVIDISTTDGLLMFERYFNATNIYSVDSGLTAHHVQFVVEPAPGTSGRVIFDEYGRTFPVFNVLMNSSYVKPMGLFGGQTVYEILSGS